MWILSCCKPKGKIGERIDQDFFPASLPMAPLDDAVGYVFITTACHYCNSLNSGDWGIPAPASPLLADLLTHSLTRGTGTLELPNLRLSGFKL
jgi:hypothetical protein